MKKLVYITIGLAIMACKSPKVVEETEQSKRVRLPAESYLAESGEVASTESAVKLGANSWVQYEVEMPVAGRYAITISGEDSAAVVWLEDHVENPDGREYNITGSLRFRNGRAQVIGSPLNAGLHKIRLHLSEGRATVDEVEFEAIREFEASDTVLRQNMEGEQWQLVWSDEFNGQGLPDSTKWTYNIGDWGWGNNELQYYTDGRLKNARQENGSLIIEAHKNDSIYPWSSARLTTQGRTSFLYGRIEFRAKVPPGRGAWAAGWLLGESYRDELSWPYCGEIDVLECVGYEINDTTGRGKNHATCHTRKYYFKQGNQIGSEIAVDSMFQKFHTYAIEWYPNRIEAYLDGEHYFTYDKNADEREWPFFEPQNIIVNIAVGGGWGGAKGLDPAWDKHRYELDYVRVYQKK